MARVSKWLSPLLYATSYFQRQWRAHSRNGGFTVVLCYHRVVNGGARAGLFTVERGLPPDVFEAQIRFMLRHFEPVLPRDMLDPGPRSPFRFAVTFDDGYQDNATVAVPILERLGVKAAFYAVTEFAGADRRFWWERVAAMLRATPMRTLDIEDVWPSASRAPASGRTVLSLATNEQRNRAHDVLCDLMRPLPPEELGRALDGLQRSLDVRVPESGREFPLMGWHALRELCRGGHEVGCHSANHLNLRTASPAQVTQEIFGAKERMTAELGDAPRTFAYPYGHWSPVAAREVGRAGFNLAFAEGNGVVDGRSSSYSLPRVGLNRRWPFAVSYNIHTALVGAGAA